MSEDAIGKTILAVYACAGAVGFGIYYRRKGKSVLRGGIFGFFCGGPIVGMLIGLALAATPLVLLAAPFVAWRDRRRKKWDLKHPPQSFAASSPVIVLDGDDGDGDVWHSTEEDDDGGWYRMISERSCPVCNISNAGTGMNHCMQCGHLLPD